MALQEMRSDLAVGIGSKQTPQSYEDGHSATQVSGKKSFDPSDRFNAEDFQFRAFNRVGDELTFKFLSLIHISSPRDATLSRMPSSA